jgi:hypothetical protein
MGYQEMYVILSAIFWFSYKYFSEEFIVGTFSVPKSFYGGGIFFAGTFFALKNSWLRRIRKNQN